VSNSFKERGAPPRFSENFYSERPWKGTELPEALAVAIVVVVISDGDAIPACPLAVKIVYHQIRSEYYQAF